MEEPEEFVHDPRDDIYPFQRDDSVPSLEDLNETPRADRPPEPDEDEVVDVVSPPVPPAPQVSAPDQPPPAPARVTAPPRSPVSRHVESLLTLAQFYEENPEAYVPGGEYFQSAQGLLERMMNLGGGWVHECTGDEFVVRLAGLPESLGPHVHISSRLLARQWLSDIGVPEA